MTSSFDARRASLPFAVALLLAAVRPSAAQSADSPEEVVVTGVPLKHAPGELPQSITVVGGDELDRSRAATLGETLANQVGMSSSYFGAGASRPIIRGLAGARVRMLEDGVDSMDVATVSDDHAVTVDPLAADQIEIFRGPTTLLYGSGAVGGVVNTVTTRIPMRAPEDGFEGAVELRGDTVADARGGALRLDAGRERFAWHFDAAHRDSGDFDIPGFARVAPQLGEPHGVLLNSAAESNSAAFGAAWLGDSGFLGASFNAYDTLYGVPSDEAAPVRIDLEQRRLDVRGGWMELAGFVERVTLRLAGNDYEHVELEGDEPGTQFTNDGVEARIELEHRALGAWKGAFGAQLGGREFAAIGAEAFVPPVDSSSMGLFAVEQLDLTQWQVSLGGRIELERQTPANGLPRVEHDAGSLSFGAVRPFGRGLSLALSLASSERLPVAEELYSDGPHLATGVVQTGSAELGAEQAHHLDVGVRGERGELKWAVTTFATRYHDFIYLAATGDSDADTGLPAFAYTASAAEFAGLEAELFTPIATVKKGELDMRVFADVVRGELATNEPVPRLPPLRFGGRLQYHNERVLVGLEAAHYGEQNRLAAFETPTAGYTLVNADVRWRVERSGKELEWFVNASNLGDEEARKHTSFVKEIAPLPGRNYALGIRSRF
ncbi:MAG TPA: TonB-dependent receptor [Gammaproteobacteria bacterium]|nr:TonB-dependent receptor [Gammaproteobacteria bacterium]